MAGWPSGEGWVPSTLPLMTGYVASMKQRHFHSL